MSAVPLKEVIEALRFSHLHNKRKLALRIEQHGIAPPDGMVLVPRKPTNEMFRNANVFGTH